jgi:tetratricopeptide (TPR) repeat protein
MDPAEELLKAAGQALQTGRARDAVTHARAALRIQPGCGRAHAVLGLALAAMGEDDDARRELQEGVKAAPHDAQVRQYAYLALVRLGDRPGARAQLAYYCQLDRNNAQARAALDQLGGPPPDLPPLPPIPRAAVWYDGGGHATMDAADLEQLSEDAEPPPGPDVVTCPDCSKRTWKGWVCHHCGANLPRPVGH